MNERIVQWLSNSLDSMQGIKTETVEQSKTLVEMFAPYCENPTSSFWDDLVVSAPQYIDVIRRIDNKHFTFHRTPSFDRTYISFEEFMNAVDCEQPSLLEMLEVS